MSDTSPFLFLDSNFHVNTQSAMYTAFQGDYLAGTNLIYKGMARPGTDVAAASWQIAFLAYDVNNNVTSITWPQLPNGVASNDFVFQWSQRAAYTYS